MSDSPKQWHLEKTVSISHLLSTVFLFVALAGSWATVTGRVSVVETKQAEVNSRIVDILANQNRTDHRQDDAINSLGTEINENYRAIDGKLDSLNEAMRDLLTP